MDGIITYINKNYPTDWNKYIEIIPSSIVNAHHRNGANPLVNRSIQEGDEDVSQTWCSYNDTLPYLILNIKQYYISPTFYSFQARYMRDNIYPQSWYVQGSVDDSKWINISEEFGSHPMNCFETKTFSVQRFGVFKSIKFVQISNTNNTNRFCLQQLEIFGELLKRIPTKYKRSGNIHAIVAFNVVYLFCTI